MSIEQAMVEKQVFAGLAAGNQVLKELHKEMSLADVEKLMDETADSIAYQNEIDELLSTRLSVADEEDIERELDLMVVSFGRYRERERPLSYRIHGRVCRRVRFKDVY